MKPLAAMLFAVLLPAPAWAYLDPGTGTLLAQGVIAAFATVSVSIAMGWQHIKNFCRKWCGGNKKPPQDPA